MQGLIEDKVTSVEDFKWQMHMKAEFKGLNDLCLQQKSKKTKLNGLNKLDIVFDIIGA